MKLGLSFFGIACLPLVVGLGCGSSKDVADAPDGGAPSRDGGVDASVAVVDITPVYIVVDQFGYRPVSEKIAVVRSPVTGYDQPHPYAPGAKFALVNAKTGEQLLVAAATAHNGGNVDKSSGDKAWWFDFSSITAPGDYYVLDVDTGVKSFPFRIAEDVYRDVLKQAVRTFFYQRAGQKKDAMYAGAAWADEASHVGPGQDHNCRLFSAPNDASTEKDLWGGWYDAGDYNKYTRWTANYVITLLRSYTENPAIWGDDSGIPESGNGIPDLIDEVKWGLDFLTRMQNEDGSVLSIVGEASASPPSQSKGVSKYGPANTSGTLATSAAFSFASRVLRTLGKDELTTYADALLARSKKAYVWAEANPKVIFDNNSAAMNSTGLGAGNQEFSHSTDADYDYYITMVKVEAAAYLFSETKDASYQAFFDANYKKAHLFTFNDYVSPFETDTEDALLDYAARTDATASVASAIKTAFKAGMAIGAHFGALKQNTDPYLAFISEYTWGSNATKSNEGGLFYDMITFGLDPAQEADAARAAERYVHYLHGVNPFGLVYLSNMNEHGSENSVNEFYHSWFASDSKLWDRVGTSTYGPPPGFVTGGPNPSYSVDACCPNKCSGRSCSSEALAPPLQQPPQKSYKDFNTNWPLDSWSVTENSDGYQSAYIRLLSKFVRGVPGTLDGGTADATTITDAASITDAARASDASAADASTTDGGASDVRSTDASTPIQDWPGG